jgi:hypothetical protein
MTQATLIPGDGIGLEVTAAEFAGSLRENVYENAVMLHHTIMKYHLLSRWFGNSRHSRMTEWIEANWAL